jgi:putative transposase
MEKRGHSEEEILHVLREAESGETVVEVCRKHGISQQSFYLWKKKYDGLGLSELRELRQLAARLQPPPPALGPRRPHASRIRRSTQR